MANKKFSELETASEIKNSDFMALSQDTGGGYVSLKATILAIATKIVTAINFSSALTTTDKTITGAINEIAEGGGGSGTDVIAEDFDSTATYAVGDYCIYDGKLYKCTTAVTTAGDWDSSDWTETLVMDEVEQGGGGGGGGGHTIKDDSGNALTQRANLQFKGVYTHDNSSGNASVVEVAREMTWAEYQQLSASEKKGLITITDRFTADAMFVNGVFIDTDNEITSGTYSASNPLSYTATEDCIFVIYMIANNSHAYLYIDNVMVYDVFSNGTQVFAPMIMLKKGQTLSTVTSYSDSSGYTVYGIQSGTNPSIPDYSTTEHKTGRKWVDGKDIWECSTTTHSNLPYDESWVDSGIEITGDVISVYGSITRDNEPIPLGANFNSTIFSKWIVRNNKLLIGVKGDSGETYKINNITAEYTKSS